MYNTFLSYFHEGEWEIKAFYPYTSSVRDRILEQSHNYKCENHEELNKLWDYFWSKAEKLGCKLDNKIVLKLEKKDTSLIYIGRYDGLISIGLSFNQDKWLEKNGMNKYF